MRRLIGSVVALGLVLLMVACGNGSTPTPQGNAPALFREAGYQWQANLPVQPVSVPLSTNPNGPAQQAQLRETVGLGPLLQNSNIWPTAVGSGSSTLHDEIAHLQSNGWKVLVAATKGGAYPDYVEFAVLQAGAHFCIVEYGATVIAKNQASQEIDLLYS